MLKINKLWQQLRVQGTYPAFSIAPFSLIGTMLHSLKSWFINQLIRLALLTTKLTNVGFNKANLDTETPRMWGGSYLVNGESISLLLHKFQSSMINLNLIKSLFFPWSQEKWGIERGENSKNTTACFRLQMHMYFCLAL